MTALLSPVAVQAEVFLDNFDVDLATLAADSTDGNVTSNQENLSTDDVFLGLRRTTVQGDLASGSVQASISSGVATYTSNNPEFNGSIFFGGRSFDGRLILTYLQNTRFEPVDLTTLPGDVFAIDVASASFGGDPAPDAEVSITGGSVAINLVESPAPYTLFVPFRELEDSGSNLSSAINLNFDFSQIGPNSNFTIESIRIVPEPASAALMLTSTASLLLRRQRQTTRRS